MEFEQVIELTTPCSAVSFVPLAIWLRSFNLLYLICDETQNTLIVNLTNIPVVIGVSGKSDLLKLKTCALYHENLILQKFNDMITQVLK